MSYQKGSRTSRIPGSSSSRPRRKVDDEAEDTSPPVKKIKTRPLMSIARPPIFDLSGMQSVSQSKDVKERGKEKGKEKDKTQPRRVIPDDLDNRLWIDKYGPTNEEDLAVHKRKVHDVRQWLLEAFGGGPSGKLKKYRRILVLTGPAGTAKTATLKVLSRELGYDILEWQNAMDERFPRSEDFPPDNWDRSEYESLSEKFRTFLMRASACHPIFPSSTQSPSAELTQRHQYSSSTAGSSTSTSRRQVILVEDLPNILHTATQSSFHATLEGFVAASDGGVAPLVLIISDAGLRGEGEENSSGWKSRSKEAMDVRSVLPPHLLHSPYVTQIGFNPIAATYMHNALKGLLDRHFASSSATAEARPSKDVLDVIVESSNGDIRGAIMALQFACTAGQSTRNPTKGSKKGAKRQGPSAAVMLGAVTRREQSLALFHLLGKIMYNKRKGDPPAQSASAKDIRRDREIDARLRDPPALPRHLQHHERKASRVDVETLYADTPIDASLLSLYIHQNYTQYCNTLEECDALVDSLSWVDSSGGETWHQANPHQFHLVALGTLHALPTPVPRRNQKPFKPAFFETFRNQGEAEDGVKDVQMWLQRLGNLPVSAWSQRDVALGVGTVLRLGESLGTYMEKVPSTHRLFSKLEFAEVNGERAELIEEGDVAVELPEPERETRRRLSAAAEDEQPTGTSLSDDDIEEW